MSMINWIPSRCISTSSFRYGKRNFSKILLINKRGSNLFKKTQATNPDSNISIDKRGVRKIGFDGSKQFIEIKEMIPQLIVPSLNNFPLKPYVSYKSQDVCQSKFSAKDLFNIIYKKKIMHDFKNSKLDSLGKPFKPSQEEKLTSKKAKSLASKSGSDIFMSPTLSVGTVMLSHLK